MRTTCSKDHSNGGWADDWTAALQAPSAGQVRNATPGSPPGSPPALTQTTSGLPCVPGGDADSRAVACDAFPSPHRLHYCSAAERDEWAAVLGAREPASAADGKTADADAGNAPPGASPTETPVVASPAAAACAAAEPPWTGGAIPGAILGETLTGAGGCSGRVVLAAIELGSHSTRAVLHDGRVELARLTFDTMLGQTTGEGSSSSRSSGAGVDLAPEAIQRTLDALQAIQSATATAMAASAAAAAAAARSTEHCEAEATAVPPAEVDTGALAARPRPQPPPPHMVARAVATAAVRNASDASREALAAAVETLLGCALEVLTGEQEGRLAWRGVVGGFNGLAAMPHPPQHITGMTQAEPRLQQQTLRQDPRGDTQEPAQQCLLVVDLGGRSTEFVYGPSGADTPQAVSLPLGCVSLHGTACRQAAARAAIGGAPAGVCAAGRAPSESDAREDTCRTAVAAGAAGSAAGTVSPSLEDLEGCIQVARDMVERLGGGDTMPWLSEGRGEGRTGKGSIVVIFTGGTVTTVAALHQQLPYYDRTRVHGSVLLSDDIAALMARLADAEGRAGALASYSWLTEARCRTLAAGCAGLLGVMAALGVEQVTVSDADLLDGLLRELLESWH